MFKIVPGRACYVLGNEASYYEHYNRAWKTIKIRDFRHVIVFSIIFTRNREYNYLEERLIEDQVIQTIKLYLCFRIEVVRLKSYFQPGYDVIMWFRSLPPRIVQPSNLT
jgi:hypothetical protein